MLLSVPLANLLVSGPGERGSHLAGLALTSVAVAIAVIAYRMVQRGQREQWLPLATSLMDVSLVSFALLTLSLIGDPHQAVNSKVTFETYFLAIGATCLRYDLRVSVIAGFVAMLEYGRAPDRRGGVPRPRFATRYAPWVYGRFYWSDQASRLILLTLHTILCTMIVSGSSGIAGFPTATGSPDSSTAPTSRISSPPKCAAPGGTPGRLRWRWWTSTGSRTSTTPTATRRATWRSRRWRRPSSGRSGAATWWRATAAKKWCW